MPVTLPTSVNIANTDAATDDPKQMRADLLDLMQKFNTLLGQVNALGIMQVGEGVEQLANGAGVKDALRVRIDATGGASLSRSAAGLRVAAAGVRMSMLDGMATDTPGNSLYYGTNASGARGAFALPVGRLLQRLHQQSSTYQTFSTNTLIPRDNTPPLITEGNQLFSQAITLANAANKVAISGIAMLAASTSRYQTVAVFRGSTCIFASNEWAGGSEEVGLAFAVEDAPGSTGPHTYSLRVGAEVAVTQFINGLSTGAIYGGTYLSSFTLHEFAP